MIERLGKSNAEKRTTKGLIIDHDKRKMPFALPCRKQTGMMKFALSLMGHAESQTDALDSESPSVRSPK